MCRKLGLDDAMTQMRFARTDKGAVIYNLLASARHNAINDFKMNPDYLIVGKESSFLQKINFLLIHLFPFLFFFF